MRVHFSTFVTIFVALLFVAGTVGCRSNGGTWYNPKSYTWTKPFGKDSQAPPYTPDALANPKPSLDSHPNIDRPAGGYSDESSLQANRSAAQSGPSSGYSHDQGGYQNTVATNPYGSYSVAEPSPYPPTYASGQPTVASTAPQQYQYQPEIVQQGGATQHGYNDYPAGTQYQPTNAVYYPSATPNYAAPNYGTVDNYSGTNAAMSGSNYSPFGAMPQQDTYAPAVQQPAPTSYTNEVPAVTPYQPYQPQPQQQPYQPVGGYSY